MKATMRIIGLTLIIIGIAFYVDDFIDPGKMFLYGTLYGLISYMILYYLQSKVKKK